MSGLVPRAALTLTLLAGAWGAAHAAGDPASGQAVFQTSCGICHSAQPGQNKIGPTLSGVFGRRSGAVPGYTYSPANQNANLVWDAATLDTYLESPRTVIPGTKMTYGGVKDAAKRANLIAYLATLR